MLKESEEEKIMKRVALPNMGRNFEEDEGGIFEFNVIIREGDT